MRQIIRSEYSSTVSDSSIGSCMMSCESSDCSHHSKSPSNSCSNASSCSLTSNMSSLSDEQTDDTTDTKTIESSPTRMPTRSSMSNSDISRSNNQSYDSNNSCNTTKSSSTVVTAKVTRSTAKASVLNEALESYKKESESELPNKNDKNEKKKCLWHKCTFVGNATEVDDSLVAHIKAKHIFSQKDFRKFRCMWKGCSVYQKPSCHFNWLERHVVDHIDTKPFMCIFNGCRRKFRTEEAREKHCQCHINTTENLPTQIPAVSSLSPVKTRNAQLLNTAKQSLIQNIKNKNNSDRNKPTSEVLKSSKPLPNYSQILKTLTKKRKMQVLGAKKFKKAQFKDFIDDSSVKVLSNNLNLLNYESGTCTFSAEIIGSHYNNSTNSELFLVQWSPVNILENEWVDKNNLQATKQITIADLPKNATSLNPFYRSLRFRLNKRK